MSTTRHLIRLVGASAARDRIDGRALQSALRGFVTGAEKAVRLRAEGRSTARGGLPAWLVECSAFEFQASTADDPATFTFVIEDAPVAERATRFAQEDLFLDGFEGKSGLDLFEDGLEAALLTDGDSDLFDDGMLESFVALGQSLRWGIERIEVVNGRTVTLGHDGLARIAALTHEVAKPQHVRVAGKLEVLRHTKCRFLLQLEDGSMVAGRAETLADEELARLFGRQVVVEGTAHFHPSGRVQRIEAIRLAPAEAIDFKLFSSQPKALLAESAVLHPRQSENRGRHWLDDIWGKWPGDETEEEIVEIIKEFS